MSKNDRKRGSRKTKNSKADSNNFITLVSRLSEMLFINGLPAPFQSHMFKRPCFLCYIIEMADVLIIFILIRKGPKKRYQNLFPVPLPFQNQVLFSQKITRNWLFQLRFVCFALLSVTDVIRSLKPEFNIPAKIG